LHFQTGRKKAKAVKRRKKMKNEAREKIASAPDIQSRIFTLRGEKVLLDSDLAQIYGVPTGALNRAVKRNKDRFPEDFLFKLTADEIMRCQIGIASRRNIRFLPYAFTELARSWRPMS
jgi:ORF6N domain